MSSTNNNIKDFIERCENRLSLLNNKQQDNVKTQQSVTDSVDKTKTTLRNHAKQIKETFCKVIDENLERIYSEVDTIYEKDLQYLKTLEDAVTKDIEKLNKLITEAKSMHETASDQMMGHLGDINKGFHEMPVVSLSFNAKVDDYLLSNLCEKSRDLMKLGMTGNVQIIECLGRHGSIIVKWDEQHISDSESVTTDASSYTEYILQTCKEPPPDGENMIFNTIYEGKEMQYTLSFVEPGKIYAFRVCQYLNSGAGSGVMGPWSMVKQAVTSLQPHVWRYKDCITDSGLELYQLSNENRTATKIFPEGSRILRSESASYTYSNSYILDRRSWGSHSK